LGEVPYGASITKCNENGVFAITFDDGPYTYTAELLDYLKSENINATFFITADNGSKGYIGDPTNQYYVMVQRMLAEGHQIGGHTWTHQDLVAIGHEYRMEQMYKNEMALGSILGMIPTYMRPPYLSCDGPCETDMLALGYHIVSQLGRLLAITD
jgi:peptidoglycan/xylan/chitin deacetylase (PgdA/CDA1 family)